MATRTRAFGQQIQVNVARKALAVKANHVQNVTNLKHQPQSFLIAKSTNSFRIEDQENLDLIEENEQISKCCPINNAASFVVLDTFPTPGEKNKIQEDLLQENIEAVKKELNSFLIDSLEKSDKSGIDHSIDDNDHVDQHMKNLIEDDVSFMNVEDQENDENIDRKNIEIPEFESQLSQCASSASEISYVQHYSDLELMSDYSEEILMYMLAKERQSMANPFYMNKQQHINSKMRAILVDWMIDVIDEYNLKDETFFLALNYIDRFLSNFSISRQEFQLLGTAALFIASKYEEIYPPEIGDFVYITDDSFTKTQVLLMEKTILNGLSFDLSVPTSSYFLEYFASDLVLDKPTVCLAKYLTYLTTLENQPFLKYYPSEIAFCSIMMASKILGNYDQQISAKFVEKSLQYEKSLGEKGDVILFLQERNNLMEAMNQLRIYASKHPQQSIQKRFSIDKYYNVTKIADEAQLERL